VSEGCDVVSDNGVTTSDKWVKVSKAAVLLGVSERTVWRRVKRGELAIDRSVTPHLVNVSDTVSDNVTDKGVTLSDKVSEVSELEERVEGLEAELQEWRLKAEELSREVKRLEELLSEVRSERDYLRSANAAALSTSQRLLEHIEGAEEGEPESEGFGDWLRRVFPFLGGGGR
jgi:predicted RNase H-like nuclease (RuvC/YqgF family)